ncbi:MAG: hypothetical protein ACLS4Z_02680 [Christensenellaceae bacterium]
MLVSAENMAFGFAGSPLLKKILRCPRGTGSVIDGEGKTTLIPPHPLELEPEDGPVVKNGIRSAISPKTVVRFRKHVFEEMKEISPRISARWTRCAKRRKKSPPRRKAATNTAPFRENTRRSTS